MTTLFLVRHGLTAMTGKMLYGRRPGIPLDDRGRRQAEELARRLEPVRVTAIYSSPLERCVQTVEPVATARKLPIVRSDALLEMEAGDWTGRSLPRLRRTKAWREIRLSPAAFRFPGGEGFAEAQARAVAEIERLARRHRRGRVVVATHGDIVRMLVAHYQGIPLDSFQRVVADTGSVSVLHLERDAAHVLLVNDTGGLARFAAHPAAPWEAASPDGSRRRPRAQLRG